MPISSSSSSFGSAATSVAVLPLTMLGQHRRGRLRDRAAAALEADVLDRLAVGGELDRDRDLVAAERVLALGVRVGVLDQPVAPRVLVVVEDDLAVHVLHQAPGSIRRTAPCARRTLAASRSISSGIV